MKKIIIIILLFFVSSQVVFARVTDDPVDYGANPLNWVQPSTDTFLYKKNGKSTKILTVDVRDLQAQIIELDKKNAQLVIKISQLQNNSPTVSVSQPQVLQNDIEQTQKIDALEKRVGIMEKVVGSLKSAIDKTLGLLTKLLSLIK